MTNGFTDRQDLDALFAATYEELRRLAALVKRRHQSATLSPTALVHEAWLKLSGSHGMSATSELHFKRIAARAMRQVLIDYARRRNTSKRGGPSGVLVTMSLSPEPMMVAEDELIALDATLDKLASMNPRQAAMVESRFFGGLEMGEIAELLGISETTVLRDWRAAKAWLAQEVRRS
ncbi:MAG TPA: ECF-type sigma factor [Bryobacteraceae bacterium]|nr:ECF-type sigma factor [Bryobacteraceae bacterium]